MSLLPDAAIQAERDLWFVRAMHPHVSSFGYGPALSSNALLLELDIHVAFVAGAWISVIALCFASIESQVRQVRKKDFKKAISELAQSNPDFDWLRNLRNEIAHSTAPGSHSALWRVVSNDLSDTHAALEVDAKRAIEVMARHIYRPDG